MWRNTVGKNKQTPQGSVRTTSAVDLEEFCEKHYEKLLPIMADKYEYGHKKRKKMSPRRQRRSRSPRHSPSVFTRLRHERSRSPRHEYKSKVNKRITSVQRREQRKSGNTSVHYPIAVQESQDTRKNTLQAKRSEDGTVEV
ncbi:hypothetical protein Tco_0499753 [Tanacetum coccineum]